MQDAWCEKVLGVQVPAGRRARVRQALLARRQVAGQRLAARIQQAPGLAAEALAAQAGALNAAIEQALATQGFTDDTRPAGEFATAIDIADTILGQMDQVGAATAPLAAQVQQDAMARRNEIRTRLSLAARAALDTKLGPLQGRVLAVLSPDQLDLKLRDAQVALQAALASPDFAADTGPDGSFRAAAGEVQDRTTKLRGLITQLGERADRADTLKPALEAITAAQATAATLTPGAIFADLIPPIAQGLARARATLLSTADAGAAAATGLQNAAQAAAALAAIKAADAAHTALDQPVKAATAAADPTAGMALRTRWSAACRAACAAAAKGEDGAALLQPLGPAAEALASLTLRAKALRDRGKALAATFGQRKGDLAADHLVKIGDVAAVTGALRDLTGDTEAAAEQRLGETEASLAEAVKAADGFKAIHERLSKHAATLPVAATIKTATVFATALANAEAARRKTHATGEGQIGVLDALVADYSKTATEMAALDRQLDANPAIKSRVSGDVGELRKSVGTALRTPAATIKDFQPRIAALQARIAAEALYAAESTKFAPRIKQAKQIRGASVTVQRMLDRAQKAAEAGQTETVRRLMADLPAWLDALADYQDQGRPTIEAAQKLPALPDDLGNLIGKLRGEAQKAVAASDFTTAIERARTLAPLLEPVKTLAAAHAATTAQFEQVAGLGVPANTSQDGKQDQEFAARLAAAVTTPKPDSGDLNARTKQVTALGAEIAQAIKVRRRQVEDDLGAGSLGKDKAKALFADEATAGATGRLYGALGKDALAGMLGGVANGAADPAATAKAARELGAIGGEGVKMLQTQLGSAAHVGALCDPDGGANLPRGLAEQFKAKPADLGTLMTEGVGNDIGRFAAVAAGSAARARGVATQFASAPATLRSLLSVGLADDADAIKGVFGNAGSDGVAIKALSDRFATRTDLARLVTNLGGADAGKTMKTLADRNFGGDWGKLKTPFFDELAANGDGNRLMQNAIQFAGQPAPSPAVAAHGFTGVAIAHVFERHNPANFDFSDIKDSNTQFAADKRKDIAAIAGEAIAQVRALRDGKESTAVLGNPSPGFIRYVVTLPGRGNLSLQVGYTVSSDAIDQVVPLDGDQYTDAQMQALKRALAK